MTCRQTTKSTSAATSTSNFTSFTTAESNIVSHMELSLYKTVCNQQMKKSVYVFIGYEYKVQFYSNTSGQLETLTGIIDSISGSNSDSASQYFTLKYQQPNQNSTTSCNPLKTEGMPNCGCVLNKVSTSKYSECVKTIIPISNIVEIEYVAGDNSNNPCCRESDGEQKGVVKVVLLGISADIVKAVVINLKMLDDGSDTAVKDVDLKVGNTYTIVYYSNKDKAIYEFDGKLTSINEVDTEAAANTIIHCHKKHKEQIGFRDTFYETCCTDDTDTDTDDYLTSDPVKNDIQLVFDTSMDYNGAYETIMLSWIRDCTLINEAEEESNDTDDTSTDMKDCNCCCNPAIMEVKSGDFNIVINGNDNTVSYDNPNGSNGTITLQELVDFYFAN